VNTSVIGLGRLGLPFGFFLASKGHKVFAYDKDLSISDKIKKKSFIEPNLSNYIKKYKKNFILKKNINELINNSGITFIVLPTPSKKDGSFSNSFILKSLSQISSSLKF